MTPSDVSIEVAEHVLKRFSDLNPGPITPYRVVTCPGSFPPGRRNFVDMDGVWTDIQIRNGRMVIYHPAFKLQQWLAAEALLLQRWPSNHTPTVPARFLNRIEVDRLERHPNLFSRWLRRSKRRA